MSETGNGGDADGPASERRPRKIDPQNIPRIEELPSKGLAVGMLHTKMEIRSGPIPSAEELERYARFDPSIPALIIRMASEGWAMTPREQEHRHDMERQTLRASVRRDQLGLAAAFVIALALIATGFKLALVGCTNVAMLVFGGGIATVAGLFLNARRADDKKPRLPSAATPRLPAASKKRRK